MVAAVECRPAPDRRYHRPTDARHSSAIIPNGRRGLVRVVPGLAFCTSRSPSLCVCARGADRGCGCGCRKRDVASEDDVASQQCDLAGAECRARNVTTSRLEFAVRQVGPSQSTRQSTHSRSFPRRVFSDSRLHVTGTEPNSNQTHKNHENYT